MDTNTEYVEPVNFKGTKGKWDIFHALDNNTYITGPGNDIANVYGQDAKRDTSERKANAILLSQSKEMLKLLKWISRVTNNPEIGIKCDEQINKALNINQ